MDTATEDAPPFQLQALVTFGQQEDVINLGNDAPVLRPSESAPSGMPSTGLRALISGSASTNRLAFVAPEKVEIRCAEGFERNLYIGCSDGTLLWYTMNDGAHNHTDLYTFVDRRTLSTKKAIIRIALIPRLSKALVLSDSTLFFFLLPSLEPIPYALINPFRGVLTFALDDNELMPLSPKSERSDEARLCILTKRVASLWSLKERLMPIKDVPLPYRGLVAKRAGSYMFIANEENYNFVDLDAGESTPAAPIPTGGTTAAPARPIIITVAYNEFLIACDGGAGAMGLFMKSGDPVRGTIEWPLLPRALAVDWPYVTALLPNGTIQVHAADREDLRMVQTITLPTTLASRTLSSSMEGFYVSSAQRNDKLSIVSFRLLPFLYDSDNGKPALEAEGHEPSSDSGLTPPSSPVSVQRPLSLLRSHILIVGSNGIHAATPSMPAAQAETLLSSHRVEDAVKLINDAEQRLGSTVDDEQFRYVRQRVGFTYLVETQFEKAGEELYRSRLDPRLLIRLFVDLRGSLLTSEDRLDLFKGVEQQIRPLVSIDQIVQNYAPHLEPDVQSAPLSADLRRLLDIEARSMLLRYLQRFRRERTQWSRFVPKPAGLDQIVDTVLLKLLAQEADASPLYTLLDTSKVFDAREAERWFLDLAHYGALVRLYAKTGNEVKLLEALVNVADGVWIDEDVSDPVKWITELVHASRNSDLVQKYGLWLLKKDPISGLKAFTARDPKRAIKLDDLQVLDDMLKVDEPAGEQFLEYLVLQRRNMDPRLHGSLAKRYMDRVTDLLHEASTVKCWEELHKRYVSEGSRTPFLSYFASSDLPREHRQARLRAALFLQASALYTSTVLLERLLEYPVLKIEIAILRSKANDHRVVLQMISNDIHDYASAQSYCTSGGSVIPVALAQSLAFRLKELQPVATLVAEGTIPGKGRKGAAATEEEKGLLLRMLLEIQMSGGAQMAQQTANLLNAQAMYFDAFETLAGIPPSWPLAPISPFFNRSYRQALHERHEGQILKGISSGQNLEVGETAWTIAREQGAVVEEAAPVDGEKLLPLHFDEKSGMDNDDVVNIRLDDGLS